MSAVKTAVLSKCVFVHEEVVLVDESFCHVDLQESVCCGVFCESVPRNADSLAEPSYINKRFLLQDIF